MAVLFFARGGLVRMTRPLSDFYTAGRLVPAFFNALAIAGSSVGAVVFAGASGAVDFDWQGTLVLLAGAGLGLVLAGVLLAPYLRGYGGFTLPDFLAERFEAETMRPLGVFGVVLCSFPALAAVMLAFGLLGQAVFAIPIWTGVAAGGVLILVATLLGGMRSLSLSQLAYYAVMLLAGVVAVLAVLWQTGAPAAMDTLLVDEVVPSLPWKPFAQTSPVNSFALLFCLAAGMASFPYLLMRSFTAPDAVDARAAFVGAPVFLVLLCLAGPALAGLYEAASIASGDPLSMIAEAVLVVGAVAVLLSTGAAVALCMGNVLSYDLYFKSIRPAAPVSRQLFAARLAIVATLGLAGAMALKWPDETMAGTAAAFSLAASAFLPVLVLGVWWKRLGGEAAAAGMVAGLIVCLYYMIAPQTIPFLFYESSSFLSDATQAQTAAYEALRQNYYVAADAAAQGAVLTKWKASVQPIANWFGVHGALAGVFGVPAGFLVAGLAGLFTSAPSAGIQRFVESLRAKPVWRS